MDNYQELLGLTKEFAEALIYDLISDDGRQGAECLSCNSFGAYPDLIKHTTACVVPKAKLFLKEINGE